MTSRAATAETDWQPELYLKYGGERLRPALDLLARVRFAEPAARAPVIYDLGCGAGNVTAILAERWPAAALTGVDSSRAMLEEACARRRDITWSLTDISRWSATEPADLIFSNAALHWLDDHAGLFPRLLAQLVPGGCLAVQMPANFDAPSHRCIRETIEAGSWRDRLLPRVRTPVAEAAAYYDILAAHTAEIDIWQTEYLHVLDGENPVVEWTKATSLRPYLEALEQSEQAAFLADYAERIADAYPSRPDGRTLFPFRRLFILAWRP